MLEKLRRVRDLIGNTPIVRIPHPDVRLYAKMEGLNYTGSIKDRPAFHILEQAIRSGKVDESTVIVESSSGNFAVALATLCRLLDLEFIAVIDKYTNRSSAELLEALCGEVVKVTEADHAGGCLLNRIARVREICDSRPNSFWPNQYENPLNAEAHYRGTAAEICEQLDRVDYFFAGVSSGGTIAGASRKIKERFPDARVIAVDMFGSVIFGAEPRPRPIPGIGSSMRPKILDGAEIDDVVWVHERATIEACHRLLNDHGLFVGGSSGSALAGIEKYFDLHAGSSGARVAFLCPDRGNAYLDTIYSPDWAEKVLSAA